MACRIASRVTGLTDRYRVLTGERESPEDVGWCAHRPSVLLVQRPCVGHWYLLAVRPWLPKLEHDWSISKALLIG